jgi:hypothetical protein
MPCSDPAGPPFADVHPMPCRVPCQLSGPVHDRGAVCIECRASRMRRASNVRRMPPLPTSDLAPPYEL